MSDLTIARRYARALAESAVAEGKVSEVDADVVVIRDIIASSRELMQFFISPIISREKKADVVDAVFKGNVQPVSLRFMGMLVTKRREHLIPTVMDAYHELRNEVKGIVDVQARVAFELSEDDTRSLQRVLDTMTGKSVHLTTRVEPGLMGGMVVQVGDKVYDGSVKNQLATLHERLAVS